MLMLEMGNFGYGVQVVGDAKPGRVQPYQVLDDGRIHIFAYNYEEACEEATRLRDFKTRKEHPGRFVEG